MSAIVFARHTLETQLNPELQTEFAQQACPPPPQAVCSATPTELLPWAGPVTASVQTSDFDPKHRLATNNLALTLGEEKRYSESFQIFRNSGLSEAQCHCNIAFILWSQGKLEEALSHFKAAVEIYQ